MDKSKAGYTEGTISIIANTGLFFLKMWAGIVSGSIALTADAWHTLSDSFSSVIVIAGAKLSSRKPDKKHPYGHGRWEHVASIFIGFLLGIIAWDFLKDAFVHFRDKDNADFGTLAIVVTVVSIAVKEGLAQLAFYLGRKSDNLSVKADGWHHRTDALSSIAVLIGIFFSGRFWWIDSVLGAVIALMLFYAAFEIIKDAINRILGEEPDATMVERIKQIIHSMYDQELSPHHFHIHNYVSSKELTFHIKVEGRMDVMSAHRIATSIEQRIRKEMDIMATIHIEPVEFVHQGD